MRVTEKRRKGFTLAEVLVTVSIIAILSAVVVPSVVRQIDKGDTGRIANDVSNIRTGVEQFVTDVRKYPGDVGQLTHAIAGSTDVDLVGGVVYTTSQQDRWKGPYVSGHGRSPSGKNQVSAPAPCFRADSRALSWMELMKVALSQNRWEPLQTSMRRPQPPSRSRPCRASRRAPSDAHRR